MVTLAKQKTKNKKKEKGMKGTARDLTYDGIIEVIKGPMFAGKSSELLRRVKMHIHANKKCLVVKSSMDNRHKDEHGNPKKKVITHDGVEMDAVVCRNLCDITLLCIGPDDCHDVVAIDEGQFFPDLVKFAEGVANRGCTVIVSCLSGSYERKPMGDIPLLESLAEKITLKRAICKVCCSKKAAFTKEIVAGSVGKNSLLVGGAETYVPVCRKCFYIPH